MSLKNLHLIVSAAIIIPVGLSYGAFPQTTLPKLFGIPVDNINLINILRAIMGLYLAMGTLWIIGSIQPKFWQAATVSNIVCMAGLAAGRLISLLADGIPSIYFTAGFLLEALLACWGLTNLKKYPHPHQS